MLMKKVENIHLKSLHTDVALGFFVQIAEKTSLVSVPAEQEVIASFATATQTFVEAMKPTLSNSFTAARKAADDRTNDLCAGLRKYVDAMTLYPDPKSREVGQWVLDTIDKYGRFLRMSYAELYPNLQRLLGELRTMPDDSIKQINLAPWLSALENAYEEFMSITAQKVEEDANKQVGIVHESRSASEEAYYTMITRINAGAIYLGDANYADFINTVNVIINDYKIQIAASKTRAANAKENNPE